MAEVEAQEVPSHSEAPADILSEDTPIASEQEIEPENVTESAVKQEPAKENVPPKRAPGVATAKRPGASTSSATKPTASSAAASTKSAGGLSKPPTRPSAGSSVRKPASSATAPTTASSGHRSQASAGGSGDEKKKPLAAAARRTSLAPAGAHQPPANTETLAEKRGASLSTSIVRKPALPSIASSLKSTVKPTTITSTTRAPGTTSTSASRSAPVSKPAVGGAVADAKKRLSSIAGSPSTTRTTTTRPASLSASASSPSKEINELKAKLEDSETRVEELQKEIVSSQQKLLELGKQMEEEAQRVTVAEDNIRTQHNEIIEKLHASHKFDVEALQAQLAEAEVAQKTVHEASLKAVEEVQQAATAKGASDTAEAIKKAKAEYTAALVALQIELASAREAGAKAFSAVSEKEDEIATLKSQIEAMNNEVASLKTEYETKQASQLEDSKIALSDLRKSLLTEHESTLSALKLAHSTDLENGSTNATSAYEKQVADLTTNHETVIKELQKQLEEAVTAQKVLEASHKNLLEAHQTESSATISKLTNDITDLKSESELIQKQLVSAQEGLAAAAKKHELMESEIAEHEKSATASKSELAKKEQDLVSLQILMDTDGKSKDELHNKVNAELATLSKDLEAKTKEIATLHEKHHRELEKHQKELVNITNDYEKEIEALQGNSGVKDDLVALKVKHEELTKLHADATSSRAKELENLKQNLAAAVVDSDNREIAHQKIIEELRAIHAKNLDEAHDRAITAGHTAHAAELEQLQTTHKDIIAAQKKEHAAVLANMALDSEKRNDAETVLQAEIDKKSRSLAKAQSELDELKQQLALEKLARTTAEADLDATKNKRPDTSEADVLRKDLQALKDQHQAALMTAQQESAKATEEHLAVKTALEKTQAALEKQKSNAAASADVAKKDYHTLNETLTELVEEANKKAAGHQTRLKEVEANLKVKDAELAEAKAKSVAPALKTPTKPTLGLAASRFAEDLDEPEAKPEAVEGEQDSSSAALASIAKARVTLTQLDQMNEDLKKDNLRSLESITDVSSASPAV